MTLLIAEDAVPSSELDTDLSELVGMVRQRGRPVVITEDGKPTVVVMTPEEFDELTYHARFVAAVKEGLAEAEAGLLISDEDLRRELEQEFGPFSQ